MHLQNFKLQEHTIKDFTEMCERLKSVLSDLPSTEGTNKGFSNKNKSCGNKKHRCNNSDKNNRENEIYCLLHGKNYTYNTNDCQTLKQQAEERKKGHGCNRNDKCNSKKKGDNLNKEEVYTLVQFAKKAMNKETNKELKKVKNLLVSNEESK